MIVRETRRRRRPGVAAVETAIVVLLTTTIVLGVFEYGRMLMDLNLLDNAAREGCRYALANNTSLTISTDVQGIVTGYMAGETASFSNFTVTVSGTKNGVASAVNNLSPGDMITVTVTGTYKFLNIVPLIAMPTSLTLTSSVTMGCEGGT